MTLEKFAMSKEEFSDFISNNEIKKLEVYPLMKTGSTYFFQTFANIAHDANKTQRSKSGRHTWPLKPNPWLYYGLHGSFKSGEAYKKSWKLSRKTNHSRIKWDQCLAKYYQHRDPNTATFSIVRNPFSFFRSLYTYGNDHKKVKFEHFIDRIVDEHENPFANLCDNTGTCPLDFVIKNEYLYETCCVIAKKFNSESDVRNVRHNATNEKNDYKLHYTPRMRKAVQEKFRSYFDFFEYDFNGCTTNNVAYSTLGINLDHLPLL